MRRRLRLIGLMLVVVLAGYAVGNAIDWFRLPGVDLDDSETVRQVLADRSAPSVGLGRADVSVVIFTDYRCGVCRRDHADVAAVIRSEPRARFVFKEWAILSPASRQAARVALAAAYQGRYLAVRGALMQGPIDDAGIRQAAVAAGASWSRIERDLRLHRTEIDAELARTSRQAFALGLPGTPAYLVGRRLVIGGLSQSKLRRLIDRAVSGE